MEFLPRLRNKYFKLAAWKFLEPLFNVQDIFVFDLEQAGQLSSSTHPLPDGVSIKIHLNPSESDIGEILRRLGQAGLPRKIAEERLKRGDLLALVMADDGIAAYTWTTFSRAWMSEARRFLSMGKDQAVQYDTLVMPSWRGKGLQYAITRPVLQELARLGYKQTVAWVNVRNLRSIRNQVSQGKRRVARVRSIPFLGLAQLRMLSAEDHFTIECRRGTRVRE